MSTTNIYNNPDWNLIIKEELSPVSEEFTKFLGSRTHWKLTLDMSRLDSVINTTIKDPKNDKEKKEYDDAKNKKEETDKQGIYALDRLKIMISLAGVAYYDTEEGMGEVDHKTAKAMRKLIGTGRFLYVVIPDSAKKSATENKKSKLNDNSSSVKPSEYFGWKYANAIQAYKPNKLGIWRVIERQELIDKKDNTWNLYLNSGDMYKTFIKPQIVINLLKKIGIDVIELTEDVDLNYEYDDPKYNVYIIKIKVPKDIDPFTYYTDEKNLSIIKTPQKLPVAIIDEFISKLPHNLGLTEAARSESMGQLREFYKRQLQKISLTEFAYDDYLRHINDMFIDSFIEPGNKVGVVAAEALGQPVTQMALNSFHKAGSAKSVSSGIEAIRELITVTRNRKFENTTMYFLDHDKSFEQAQETKIDFVEIRMSNLIAYEPIIDSVDNLGLYWWHSSKNEQFYNKEGKNISDVPFIMRIKINQEVMLSNRLTMKDAVKALEENFGGKDIFMVVPSPMSDGMIDIVPYESKINQALSLWRSSNTKYESSNATTNYNQILTLLNLVVLPSFQDMHIKGIKGIRRLYPSNVSTWVIVADEIPYNKINKYDKKYENYWYLVLNRSLMMTNGITKEKFEHLLKITNIKIHEKDDDIDTYIVIMPAGNDKSPGKYINEIINKDINDKKMLELKVREGDIENKIMPNPNYVRVATDIERSSKLTYAETDGSNILDILSQPQIDATRSYCNNVHDIFKTLGIEAARNYLLKDIDFVLKEGRGDINQRHLILLVDFMTNLGILSPITYIGIGQQSAGFLDQSSFERAKDVFSAGAAVGVTARPGTSGDVFVGKLMSGGTGIVKIGPDSEEYLNSIAKVSVADVESFYQNIPKNDFDVNDDILNDDFEPVMSKNVRPKAKITISTSVLDEEMDINDAVLEDGPAEGVANILPKVLKNNSLSISRVNDDLNIIVDINNMDFNNITKNDIPTKKKVHVTKKKVSPK